MNRIYCKAWKDKSLAYYLSFNNKDYYLFSQNYKKSNDEVFENGVHLSKISSYRKHHSFSVRNTISKLPSYIKYIEKEYNIKIFRNKQKKKTLKKYDDELTYIYASITGFNNI